MPIRFETLAVHGGQHPDPTTLSRGVPVYRTSSYLFKSAEHAAKLFGLAEQGNVYGRLGNPTQAMLEERMSLLEGGVGALASASGTSAIFSTIVNLAKQGDEIVSANNLYGGTFTLFNDILPGRRRSGCGIRHRQAAWAAPGCGRDLRHAVSASAF